MSAFIRHPSAQVDAFSIEHELVDHTDHWRDTEPQTVLFHRGKAVGAPA
jgi:hypothetical protein